MPLANLDFDILFIVFLVLCCLIAVVNIYGAAKLIKRFVRHRRHLQESEPVQLPEVTTQLNRFSHLRKLLYRWRYVVLNLICIPLAIYVAYVAVSPEPRIVYEYSYPMQEAPWDDYQRPVEVSFNVPVSINNLRPQFSLPDLKGTWVYERYLGFLPLTRRARFYPEVGVMPDQRIVLYMVGVKRPLVPEGHDHAFNFYSRGLAEVYSVSPANNDSEISVDTQIEIGLSKDITPSEVWSFDIVPPIDVQVEQVGKRGFKLIPQKQLAQSETYTVVVNRTWQTYDIKTGDVLEKENPEKIHELVFSTVRAPLIKRFSPTGTGVRETTIIAMSFEVDMDRANVEESLQVAPAFEYALEWENDHMLTLTPQAPLAKETEYTISFPAGLRSGTGGVSDREIVYTFTTIGAVKVQSIAPQDGLVKVARTTPIAVTFDQEVDHASAQSKFSLIPASAGNFSWSGNTMTFTPTQAYAFETTYTITVDSRVKTVYGLDSRDKVTSKFTTVSNVTVIAGFGPTSFDQQDYNMSCAVGATKMALSWKGIRTSEYQMIQNMGIEPYQYLYDSSIGAYRWGDPQRGFVGTDINGGGGTDPNRAYGVYWLPIQRMLKQSYGVDSEVKTNWNATALAQTVAAGHPVQVWGWNGFYTTWGGVGGSRMDWYTSDGRQIYAINGMHSWLVVGFYGDPTNPTHFVYLDPWKKYIVVDKAFFLQQWSYFGNTGLIIY